jgi:hypothetical protein
MLDKHYRVFTLRPDAFDHQRPWTHEDLRIWDLTYQQYKSIHPSQKQYFFSSLEGLCKKWPNREPGFLVYTAQGVSYVPTDPFGHGSELL